MVASIISFPTDETNETATATTGRLEELLRFGGLMLSAGQTAFRVRRSMTAIARTFGFDLISIQVGARNLLASGRRNGETVTMARDVDAPSVNTARMGALERLVETVTPYVDSHAFLSKLVAIETAPPRYTIAQTAMAVGAACGSFSFLNGGGWVEVAACWIGGGVGQALRSFLIRRRLNQYAITTLCAMVAALLYCAAAVSMQRIGFAVGPSSAGVVSSVLFLIPGFPLVTAVLDQLQNETAAAVSRLAHAMMFVLTAAVGLSVVIAFAGFPIEASAQIVSAQPLTILGCAVASFYGGCGLAILYNGTWRNVLFVGVLALIGNELRLLLHGFGVTLPSAAFLGAFAVGLTASLVGRWIKEARMALTVPAAVMMVPGVYAFETLFYFYRGEILKGVSAGLLVGFVVGSIAFGLAAARLISHPERKGSGSNE